MRFNELISGVRSDVAVKIYGDDFSAMEKTASQLVQTLKTIDGSADVKMEQTSGLPMLEVKLDKNAIARYGLNVSDVLDVLSIAVGGREAGLVFQGDRRFDILVRLPDAMRQDLTVLENLPVLLPADDDNMADRIGGQPHTRPAYIPLKQVAKLEITDGLNQISRENGKRRMVVQANVRGRDIGSFVKEAQTVIDSKVQIPAGGIVIFQIAGAEMPASKFIFRAPRRSGLIARVAGEAWPLEGSLGPGHGEFAVSNRCSDGT